MNFMMMLATLEKIIRENLRSLEDIQEVIKNY